MRGMSKNVDEIHRLKDCVRTGLRDITELQLRIEYAVDELEKYSKPSSSRERAIAILRGKVRSRL